MSSLQFSRELRANPGKIRPPHLYSFSQHLIYAPLLRRSRSNAVHAWNVAFLNSFPVFQLQELRRYFNPWTDSIDGSSLCTHRLSAVTTQKLDYLFTTSSLRISCDRFPAPVNFDAIAGNNSGYKIPSSCIDAQQPERRAARALSTNPQPRRATLICTNPNFANYPLPAETIELEILETGVRDAVSRECMKQGYIVLFFQYSSSSTSLEILSFDIGAFRRWLLRWLLTPSDPVNGRVVSIRLAPRFNELKFLAVAFQWRSAKRTAYRGLVQLRLEQFWSRHLNVEAGLHNAHALAQPPRRFAFSVRITYPAPEKAHYLPDPPSYYRERVANYLADGFG
ncbi:hypothetical protein R3P38DRAFT_2816309 [Favolaschia claudopus]|uniref:Uncharacterized protein n=1 Tax=Favolaschia claudopus TaxID=2862362 RepID=A0AAV9YZB2_9AGAR